MFELWYHPEYNQVGVYDDVIFHFHQVWGCDGKIYAPYMLAEKGWIFIGVFER